MVITFASTFPVNGATAVSRVVATTNAHAITLTLQSSDPPINQTTLSVIVNGTAVITGGAPQASAFSPVITPSGSTLSVSLVFFDPAARFNSFETVTIAVTASDNTSQFSGGFTFRVEDIIPPVIAQVAPADGSSDNAPNTPIFFQITDQGSGATPGSLIVSINIDQNMVVTGENAILLGVIQPGYSGSITTLGTTLDVFLTRTQEFGSNAGITVNIHAEDEQNPVDGYFEFDILDIAPPTLSNLIPAADSVNIPEDTTVSLTISDNNGSGINLSKLNVKLNGTSAVLNGQLQFPFLSGSSQILLSPSPTDIQSAVLVLKPTNIFPAAQFVQVFVDAKDNRSNELKRYYSFRVRDNVPPEIVDMLPGDGYVDILPDTDIRFSIVEEYDGYGVDFAQLSIRIDGYDILNQTYNGIPVDGYEDEYIGNSFANPVFNVDGYYFTPTVQDAYDAYDGYDVEYPGYSTTIFSKTSARYDFVIHPLTPFAFSHNASVRINSSDTGGNSESVTYFFTTAALGQIITTAFPSTGTYKNFIDGYGLVEAYKFLFKTGVTLTSNLPNTTTYYTTDGSVPRIDAFGRVIGTTQVYTKPILINKQNLNVIKYFSADEALNKEPVKQEVYMIDIIPPEINEVTSIPIYADIPFPTTVIPLQLAGVYVDGYGTSTFSTDLFRAGQLVRVLDDLRPPVLTTILTINSTSNPPFLIVQDQVQKLKVSRNARVEITTQPIDPAQPINFDTASIPEFTYIGSDGLGINQADAVVDEFRILNIPSTDEEILADFTLLTKGTSFFNQTKPITLPSTYSTLEVTRANMPDNTLVLLNFNGTVQNSPRQGLLASNTTPIVDTTLASNTIIFTISIQAGEFVDRELLRTVLTNFAPTDLQVVVNFVEIG